MSNQWDVLILRSCVTHQHLKKGGGGLQVPTGFANMCPPFQPDQLCAERKSCDPQVMAGGDGIQKGAAGKIGGPLSSDLNKMAWICHSVYPAVWSERGTHTKQQQREQTRPRTLQRPLCCCSCFFVQLLYCALFSKFPSLNSQWS